MASGLNEERLGIRKRVSLRIQIYDKVYGFWYGRNIVSLSANGCLVLAPKMPDLFRFYISFGPGSRVAGIAQKIYEEGDGSFGIRFTGIPSQDSARITEYLSKIA